MHPVQEQTQGSLQGRGAHQSIHRLGGGALEEGTTACSILSAGMSPQEGWGHGVEPAGPSPLWIR